MNSKEYAKIVEAYQSIYEQQKIGIDASKEGGPDKLLQKIIDKDPKKYGGGEVIRSGLQKANYEPEMDLFDYLLEYLVSEGYADTNKAALVIMANMSEGWRKSIVEEIVSENALQDVGKNISNAAKMFRIMTGIDKMPQKPPAGPANLTKIATQGSSKPQPQKQTFKIGTPPKPNTTGQQNLMRSVRSNTQSRNPGVSLPTRSPHIAAATAGLQSYNTGDSTLKAALKRGDYKPQQGPRNPDQGLTKAQSFDKAFKTARTSGQKEFTWNNKKYNTKMK